MSTCLILPEGGVLADSRVVGGDAFAKHRAILVEKVIAPGKHQHAVAAPLLTAFQARISILTCAVFQFSEVDPLLVVREAYKENVFYFLCC